MVQTCIYLNTTVFLCLLNALVHRTHPLYSPKNLKNGGVSPFLHSYVNKRSSKKTRYIYARLVDGVHSTHAPSANHDDYDGTMNE
jgi:hypothetical protein